MKLQKFCNFKSTIQKNLIFPKMFYFSKHLFIYLYIFHYFLLSLIILRLHFMLLFYYWIPRVSASQANFNFSNRMRSWMFGENRFYGLIE